MFCSLCFPTSSESSDGAPAKGLEEVHWSDIDLVSILDVEDDEVLAQSDLKRLS